MKYKYKQYHPYVFKYTKNMHTNEHYKLIITYLIGVKTIDK